MSSDSTPRDAVSVAVVGLTGLVGTAILPTLLRSPHFNLALLTTNPQAPALLTLLEAAGADGKRAQVSEIDWERKETIVDALRGVKVLVSALSSRGEGVMARWELLLDAAAEAGVEIYFPSEFGIDPTLALGPGKTPFPPAGFEEKAAHAVRAQQKGLKTYKVYTGMFSEGALSPRNGIDLENHTWRLCRDSNVPFSLTSTTDLGPILLRLLLLALRYPSLLPSSGDLRVYSSNQSWSSYASIFSTATGVPMRKDWVTKEELKAEMEDREGDHAGGGFLAFVKLLGEEGGFDHESGEGSVVDLLDKEEVGGKWEKRTVERFAKEWVEGRK